ncbi:hypothetical protein ABT121_34970 [Streptomyces sp. NPDC001928]|uniref:hypothetical protein n=1 Tax=Streptomyces sp. NPDC001928 TaxID=3154404 RepID=UPI00331FF931
MRRTACVRLLSRVRAMPTRRTTLCLCWVDNFAIKHGYAYVAGLSPQREAALAELGL